MSQTNARFAEEIVHSKRGFVGLAWVEELFASQQVVLGSEQWVYSEQA